MYLKDLEGVEVYVDGIVILSDNWGEHLKSFVSAQTGKPYCKFVREGFCESRGYLLRECSRLWSCDTN